jgi:hypothetical protein
MTGERAALASLRMQPPSATGRRLAAGEAGKKRDWRVTHMKQGTQEHLDALSVHFTTTPLMAQGMDCKTLCITSRGFMFWRTEAERVADEP